MRVIIAGSRTLTNPRLVADAVDASGFTVTEVISGGARGIDRLGEQWAEARGVSVRRFPAEWESEGRAAGHLRNRKMAENADALIAIWTAGSPGTHDMIHEATTRGLAVYVHRVGDAYE